MSPRCGDWGSALGRLNLSLRAELGCSPPLLSQVSLGGDRLGKVEFQNPSWRLQLSSALMAMASWSLS